VNGWETACLLAAAMLVCNAALAQVAVWPLDCLTRVTPEHQPGEPGALEIEGARGEIVSAQVALRSDEALTDVRPEMAALHDDGSTIPGDNVTLQWERFIEITHNSRGLPDDALDFKAPARIPDPFWEDEALDIPANFTQPLWIEVEVPRDTPAGHYEGELTIAWEGGQVTMPVSLHVRDFEVPAERHLAITNWFTFPGIPWRDTVEIGSDEYWRLAEQFAQIMVRHRQNCFRHWLSWATFRYDPEEGFSADWERFDRYAQIFFDAGMDRMELWSAGWRDGDHAGLETRIRMVDFAVETPEGVELSTEERFMGVLGELERHLQERGWADRAMIHICDEPFQPSVASYREIAAKVHEAAPSLKTIEAIEAEGFGDELDIWVPKLSHLNLWWENFRREKQQRKIELWFYTCCHPVGRYPNRFLDQPLTAVRALHWINYLYDLDGYLHWGLNHYATDDPFSEEGLSGPHPLGDHAIMYPGEEGPMGSLRWSAMRDGIEDFEYLWMLEQRLSALKDRLGDDGWWLNPRQRPEELCRRVAQSFYRYNRDSEALLAARRLIADEIEALEAEPLLFVQTSPPEHTEIPAGPRLINLYGAADPGATISVNGAEQLTVGDSGTFEMPHFPGHGLVEITAEKDGRSRTVYRSFVFVD